MTRGKDEGKPLGPMFPRVHVSDTDKGGPRAPPRNKMALYEQLSIPSQRFNPSLVPLNSKPAATEASTTKGIGHVKKMQFSLRPPPLTPVHSRQSEDASVDPPSVKPPSKVRNEDEPSIPVSVHPQIHEYEGKYNQYVDITRLTPFSPFRSFHSMKNQTTADIDLNRPTLRQGLSNCVKSSPNLLGGGKTEGSWQNEEAHALPSSTKNCESLRKENKKRGDAVSERPIADSLSALEISPDVVLGILGQKLFLEARTTINKQQQIFSGQIFELHKLIKIQRFFAGSPHLLLQDFAPLEGALKRKLPSEYTLKPIQRGEMNSDKPNHESFSEPAVQKTIMPSLKTTILPSNYEPYVYFPPTPPPHPPDTSSPIPPWCFHQSATPQWLIPVMSPSEGLIYKPYPGPGIPGPNFARYGSMGPSSQSPIPVYNAPPPNHHHHPATYFPPYNMNLPGFKDAGGPDQKSEAKFLKDSGELQGSTASSPSGRADSGGPLPFIPEEPEGEEGDPDHPNQVIRVVPHNRRSATESAARIFRSIQQERKQYESHVS